MKFANRRKQLECKERRILRDQREDAAGKLLQGTPDLASLSLAIHETRPDGCLNNAPYIRRVVLENAPALFEVPCSNDRCSDGGYDVTREVLLALASRKEGFDGEQGCNGRSGEIDCGRVLRYVATATYRTRPSAEL
jgi:hypothetical protein